MNALCSFKVRSGQYADILSGRRSFLITRDREIKAGDVVELEEWRELSPIAPTGRSVEAVVVNCDRSNRMVLTGFMVVGFRLTGELNDIVVALHRQLSELQEDYDEALEALRLHAPTYEPRKKAA